MENKYFYKTVEAYLGREINKEEYEQTQGKDGIFISKWDINDKPQPTIEQLESFIDDVKSAESNNAIYAQIDELDKKRVRAIAEPSDHPEGGTWLEYYTAQIQGLRSQLGA